MQDEKIIYAVIENNADIASLAEFDCDGIEAAPLETVCYRDLAAVVSSIDAGGFAPDLPGEASCAQEREQRLKAGLLPYQQVNSFLLDQSRTGGMLPLRFGLTARGKQEVEGVLARVYLQFRTYLDRLKGTAELVVQASWYPRARRGANRGRAGYDHQMLNAVCALLSTG